IVPRSLGEWATMVTGGSARCAAYLLSTRPGEPVVPVQTAGPPDDAEIERRLGQFLGSVSPDTARLAVYLSAVSPTPSIARIIQRALLPETGPAELAEVFLSGLIRRATPYDDDCDPDHVLYDFVGDVADQLRSRLRFSVEQKVAEVVSNDLAKRFGLPAEALRVLVEDPSGTETVDARLQHFAEYRRATQTRLSTAAQVADPTATEAPTSEPETVIERDNVTDPPVPETSAGDASPLNGALRNGYPPFATVLSGDAVVGQGLLLNGNFVVIPGSLATHYENQGLQVALRSPDNTMKTFRVGRSSYAVTEPDLAFLEIDTGSEAFDFWDEQITALNDARQVVFAQTSVGLARNPFDFGLTHHEGKGVESDESRYRVELLQPDIRLAPGALTLNHDGSFLGLALGMAEPSIVRVVSSRALLQALEAIRSNPTAEEENLTSGGYREDFLDVPIPLPGYRQTFSNIKRLDYTHHTIDFDTGRRIALLAAANYDGGQRQSSERPAGFTLDERVPPQQQLDLNSTRGSTLDRGHLIGRPEVDWGSAAEAHSASLDAFKAPNVALQFRELNRRTLIELDKWLEDLIGDGRASILIGPVYNPDDPVWRGMVVPQAFWKIVAWQADPETEPRALGFILPHQASVDGDAISFSGYRHPADPLEHLAPIGEIAELARLYLNDLEQLDCIEDFRLPASPEQSGQDAGVESDGAPEDAAKFVEGADLDTRSVETPAELPQPDYTQAIDQTVAVGSNLVEIAAKVPPELRPMVVNTFLIAQLAADRKVADTSESFLAWWETYIDVLQKTGWVIEDDNSGTKEMSGSMNEVREEVLPIIVAALGPTAATSSPIVSLLGSLDEGSEDTPWLTLFNSESRKVRGNQFGLSAVDYEDGHLRVRSFGFELEAERAVNQVLFFRSDQSKARLRHSHVSLRIGENFLRQIAAPLSARLSQYTENKIADIQIDGRTDGAPIEGESLADPVEGESRRDIELERGRHIILIGSATYDHFADLPAVGDSLKMLDDLMRHLWPGSYIHTLLDEKLSTILDVVAKVAESAAPDDQIILYFSGHALTTRDQSDPSRLCLSETDPKNVEFTSIAPRDLLGAFQRTPAGQIALFLDLPSSDPSLGFGNAEPLPSIESPSNDRKDVFILATKPEEMTTLPASGPSPFASTLAMGLAGAAGPNDDNLIEAYSLYDFMRNELMSRYREASQFDLPLVRYSRGKRAAFMVLGRALDEDRASQA
ncbi:MAG: DNA/RNA non-specific endonuclease, partial [Pseudomonadota bacterium]